MGHYTLFFFINFKNRMHADLHIPGFNRPKLDLVKLGRNFSVLSHQKIQKIYLTCRIFRQVSYLVHNKFGAIPPCQKLVQLEKFNIDIVHVDCPNVLNRMFEIKLVAVITHWHWRKFWHLANVRVVKMGQFSENNIKKYRKYL